MKRFLVPLIVLVLVLSTPAHAQLPLLNVGPGTLATAGGGGYSGPGDLKTYSIWIGTYAYSAAKRGTAAVEVCNGGVCGDLSTDATTGLLVTSTSINGAACDDSGHQCTIRTWYNQGSTASQDFVQTTAGNRATLLVSCGGLTGAACATATAAYYDSASNVTQAQPFTFTAVSYRNASVTTDVTEIGAGTTAVTLGGGYFGSTNDAYCYAGGIIDVTSGVPDANWYGKACALNSTTSDFTIGSTTNGDHDPGTNGISASKIHFMNSDGSGSRPWQGRIASVGFATSAFNTTELAAANAASKTILGF